MRDDGIGRVLVASLHQSIAETLPARLGFYENWLSEGGLREGTIGLAPTYAVLSFLRQEGQAYHTITARAGQYAAEWMVADIAPLRESIIKFMPPSIRARLLMRVMDRLVRRSYAGSRAVGRVRKGRAHIDVQGSVFCTVREPVSYHLCGYYAAAYSHLLAAFGMPADAEVVSCRGSGDTACVLTAPIGGRSNGIGP